MVKNNSTLIIFFRFSLARSAGHVLEEYLRAVGREANYHTLISTSTPEGNSNFMSASMVLEDEE